MRDLEADDAKTRSMPSARTTAESKDLEANSARCEGSGGTQRVQSYGASGTSGTSGSDRGDLGTLLLAALRKLRQDEHLEVYTSYLNSEWFYTADDLRLAQRCTQAWGALKLPARLKIELACLLEVSAEAEEAGGMWEVGEGHQYEYKYGYGQGQEHKDYEGYEEQGQQGEGAFDSGVGATEGRAWVRVWAEEHGCCYYYNTISHESAWEDPCPDLHITYPPYEYEEGQGWAAVGGVRNCSGRGADRDSQSGSGSGGEAESETAQKAENMGITAASDPYAGYASHKISTPVTLHIHTSRPGPGGTDGEGPRAIGDSNAPQISRGAGTGVDAGAGGECRGNQGSPCLRTPRSPGKDKPARVSMFDVSDGDSGGSRGRCTGRSRGRSDGDEREGGGRRESKVAIDSYPLSDTAEPHQFPRHAHPPSKAETKTNNIIAGGGLANDEFEGFYTADSATLQEHRDTYKDFNDDGYTLRSHSPVEAGAGTGAGTEDCEVYEYVKDQPLYADHGNYRSHGNYGSHDAGYDAYAFAHAGHAAHAEHSEYGGYENGEHQYGEHEYGGHGSADLMSLALGSASPQRLPRESFHSPFSTPNPYDSDTSPRSPIQRTSGTGSGAGAAHSLDLRSHQRGPAQAPYDGTLRMNLFGKRTKGLSALPPPRDTSDEHSTAHYHSSAYRLQKALERKVSKCKLRAGDACEGGGSGGGAGEKPLP
ncbi:hypothetical protein B484DRAFT_432386 [Ochromonadaceae sp. CCMP2298]|nr:hypothetical protein B484DRAFT_432386 [Ochromonadaceae sp. CCMP2298]|mmetsp:Transcript_25713/g.56874  ORF Transcript_25713/g.56874 Transcript_25713/m.56874 type:complete len:707 (+) Transcript_25713:225-2345(+)